MKPLWPTSLGTVWWRSCAHFKPCTVDDESKKRSDHTMNILMRFGCAASAKSARKDGVPRAAKSTVRTVVLRASPVVVLSLFTAMHDAMIMKRACVLFGRLATEDEAPTPTLPPRAHFGCSRACWASFRWQAAAWGLDDGQIGGPSPLIPTPRCNEAFRGRGGDPWAPLQHFNRKTTQEWPRTRPQPPYSPPQAYHHW